MYFISLLLKKYIQLRNQIGLNVLMLNKWKWHPFFTRKHNSGGVTNKQAISTSGNETHSHNYEPQSTSQQQSSDMDMTVVSDDFPPSESDLEVEREERNSEVRLIHRLIFYHF